MRLALLLGIALIPACATGRPSASTPAAPSPDTSAGVERRLAAIEARMIGLTDELDRLSHRVSRLEAGGAPSPESPYRPPASPPDARIEPRPEPTSAPEEVEAADAPPVPEDGPTGILMDLRSLGDRIAPGRTFAVWSVVDPDGEVLFSSEDVVESTLGVNPIFWQAPAGTILGTDDLPPIGDAPWIATVVSARMVEGAGVEEAVFVLGKKSAEQARELADPGDLVGGGHLVIVVRSGE